VEPGGVKVTREIIHHNGSAVIIPVFADGKILMERQFRMAAGQRLWELPAGSIDKGETPLETAKRELAEETGYTSASWRKLAEFYPSPGLLDEKMTIFVARSIRAGKATPEEDEKIATRAFKLEELLRMIRNKKIEDGKSMIGLMYFDRWGR
jgi:ADP-ribose pyrophosphatase